MSTQLVTDKKEKEERSLCSRADPLKIINAEYLNFEAILNSSTFHSDCSFFFLFLFFCLSRGQGSSGRD